MECIFGPVAFVIFIIGCVRLHRKRQRDNDPARHLCVVLEGLLLAGPEGWQDETPPFTFRTAVFAKGNVLIRISGFDQDQVSLSTPGGQWIEPTRAWQRVLLKRYHEMREAQRKASKLNAICDAIDTIGESNIVPFIKREQTSPILRSAE